MSKSKSSKNPVTVRGTWIAKSLGFLRSRVCASLSPHAVKLLWDLEAQLGPNARGNGDLTATMAVLRQRGWTSTATLRAALNELLSAELLVLTRKGDRRRCSLYAITLWPLDCDLRKLDVGPGCYSTADWTQGRQDLSEAPTSERPAIWHHPRKNIRTPATGLLERVIDPPGEQTVSTSRS